MPVNRAKGKAGITAHTQSWTPTGEIRRSVYGLWIEQAICQVILPDGIGVVAVRRLVGGQPR
jgi:hypothetical protein